MARNGTISWRAGALYVGIFAVVIGAVITIRVLTAPAKSSSPSVARTTPGNAAPASTPSASIPAVIAPHLAANVPVGQSVVSMVFSPDGKTLADELSSGVVQLRDAATGALTGSFDSGHSAIDKLGAGAVLAFSPDGSTLAVGVGSDIGFASKVEFWNVATRQETGGFPVTAASVFSLAFSPDGKTLAVGAGKSLVLHTMATGATVGIQDAQQGYQGDALFVSFSGDGKTLAVANADGLVRLWDVASMRFTTSLTIDTSGAVLAALISPDGRLVATAGSNHESSETATLWLLQTASGKYVTLTYDLTSQEDSVESAALSPAGQLFATGDDYGEIRLWNTAKGAAAATFRSPAENRLVGALAFSPNGRVLAGASNMPASKGSGGASIQLWDVYGRA